ncbi:MAG: hypothetical protein NTZ32_13505 [Planctomycetales bacterium]|nr:hypothetical protein [Planctomycetales bacterium]
MEVIEVDVEAAGCRIAEQGSSNLIESLKSGKARRDPMIAELSRVRDDDHWVRAAA